MSDYRLDRLTTREFEHLSQSLCKKFIAAGVTPFGDGPDGGREATFEGRMDYPSRENKWDGYLVVQCKFRQRPSSTSDTEWTIDELRKELKKFSTRESSSITSQIEKVRRKPKYYIFITNAILTPALDRGGRDKCQKILQEESQRIGIEEYDIWGFDDICRFLDLATEIRRAYSGFILPDDVLHEALDLLKIQEPDFDKILSKFVQKELRSDYSAKLQSAGQHDSREISLASVFLDIPFAFERDKAFESSDKHRQLIDFFLDEGDRIIRINEIENNDRDNRQNRSHIGRFAIVGGPGQGKSTVGQYLCQLYRAELIQTLSPSTVDPAVSSMVRNLISTQTKTGRMPQCRRFPFRVVLNSFATDLENDKSLTIIEYIRKRLLRLGAAKDISINHLEKWIAGYPWVFILDGLDEVPASSNRKEVLEAIEDFLVDLTTNEADVLIVSTTRPQGYSGDFAKSFFRHIYLAPLSEKEALRYGSALLRSRAGEDEERFDQAYRRLTMAAKNSATLRLMRSPLQVTIMATLVERIGDPPKQRYRLFAEYYRTIYEREVSREGALSRLLSDRKTDIDLIHHRVGLILQTASENAGDTDATIRISDFISLVRERFKTLGESVENANHLAAQIRTSTLERLVFLVSLQDEQVGFEIRSLQEFMAAEALYKADFPSLVVDRINEIALIDHWRNVLLFIIGKCFSDDNNSLLDRILVLCAEMNDAGAEYKAVKWGSQLALAVLLDGAARNYPKRERLLCQIALELLSISDNESVVELMSVYHSGLDDLYQSYITSSLSRGGVSSVGAWRALQGLIVKNIQWAKDYFIHTWDRLSPRDKAIVIDPPMIQIPWVAETLIPLIPKLSPRKTFDVFSEGFIFSQEKERSFSEEFFPQWAQTILNRAGEYWDILEEEPSKVAVSIQENLPLEGVMLQFKSVKVKTHFEDLAISDMPVENVEWLPYISVAKFLRKPSKNSLADCLEILACDSELGTKIADLAFWQAPWPLAALIAASKNEVDLLDHANQARLGKYGDTDDWLKAEVKAVSLGFNLKNILSNFNEITELVEKIHCEIPVLAMTLNAPDISDKVFNEVFSLWHSLKSKKARSIASYLLIQAVSMTSERRYEVSGRHSISATDMCDLIGDAHSVMTFIDMRIFGRFIYDEGDIEAFKKISSYIVKNGLVGYNSYAFDNNGWFDRNIVKIIEHQGLSADVAQWALWIGRSGGYPGLSNEAVVECINRGFIFEEDRFWLKFGSQDFSVSDAVNAFSYFEKNFSQDVRKEYTIKEQVTSSLDLLSISERAYICIKLQKYINESNDLSAHEVIPRGRLNNFIEQALRMRKTGFNTDAEKLRKLGISLI